MATVKNKCLNIDDKAPVHVESEGERLIKQLAAKQTNTKTTLQEQLNYEKPFETSTELRPITSYIRGATSLSDFEKTATRLNEIESLQSQGLSGSEISLRLDPESRRLPDDVVQRHLRDIETKLHSTVEARTVSRRQREALTVKPQSEETRLLQFALQSGLGERIEDVAGHPMTQLQEMEKNLFGHLERKATPGLAKRRKRMRKAEGVERHISSYVPDVKQSKWDVKEVPLTPTRLCKTFLEKANPEPLNNAQKVYTCKPQQLFTIVDGKIVKLDNKDESQRLTLNEIRDLPHFRNYEQGNPSKVLYVKNIASSGRDEVLKLFNGGEVRFMGGRMKGQAFVTYTSVDRATEALLKYNGYIIKQKPIIVQYGKSNVS